MHKQQGWPQAWEYSQAKLIQTLGRASQGVDWSWSQCIKSHHAQTSSVKGLPSHFWTRDNVRSILPGLWRKITQWSKVLFSDESKFSISFGNQGLESGGRLKRHRIQAAWSPVWSFKSSHLYLYSAFNDTDCIKALNSIKLEDRVSAMYNDKIKHSIFS